MAIKKFEDYIKEKASKKFINEDNKIVLPFDLSAIPMSELDKAYKDYEPYVMSGIYSLDEEYEYENDNNDNVEVQSARKVVEALTNMMELSDFQFYVRNPNGVDFIETKRLVEECPDYSISQMMITIPKINDNFNIITGQMEIRGYYLVKQKISKDNRGRDWFIMLFDPKKQETIREQVLKYHKYGYHTAPSYNAGSIEANGIIAQYSEKPYKTNTKRVYLYIGQSTEDPQYKRMMTSISNRKKHEDKQFTGDFVEYEISLAKLPVNVEFFTDIHGYGSEYIYTESNIPVDAIHDMVDKTY